MQLETNWGQTVVLTGWVFKNGIRRGHSKLKSWRRRVNNIAVTKIRTSPQFTTSKTKDLATQTHLNVKRRNLWSLKILTASGNSFLRICVLFRNVDTYLNWNHITSFFKHYITHLWFWWHTLQCDCTYSVLK